MNKVTKKTPRKKTLSKEQKKLVEFVVHKAVSEYGEVFRKLGGS